MPIDGAETSADLRDELATAFDAGSDTPAPSEGTTANVAAETPSAEQIQPLTAPKHWAEADQKLFGTSPREVQQRWLDREKEYAKGVDAKGQELAGYRRQVETLDALVKPFERDLALQGYNREQFLTALVGTHKFLCENPAEALKWVAQQYGVDLKSLTQEPPQVDPKLKSLEDRLSGWEQRSQQAEQSAKLAQVQAFADAKGEDGKPLRPYFDEVQADLLALIKAGEKDLDRAYNKAVRMNDDVWGKIEAEKELARKSKEEAAAKERVNNAKRAAVGTEGQVNGSQAPKSLREDLEAAFGGLQ